MKPIKNISMRNQIIVMYFYKLDPDFDRKEAADILGMSLEFVELVITLVNLEMVDVPWFEPYGNLGLN